MDYKFAHHVFDMAKIEKCLPTNFFKRFKETVDEKKSLDADVAELMATEIKKWAESMQVTHYTHWFLPLTGLTAGKQNTFLDKSDDEKIISMFSGRDLIKGEPDASSFPHGGMRSTFEARGYTAWDPASPVFVVKSNKGCILYIPSVFYGFNGKVLDKKTPLLRSLKQLNRMSLKIMNLFDMEADWVKNMIGPEQEFFLVDLEDYQKRPDLKTLGRILFASRPPKGQQMGDHYFGAIPEKVLAYLEDVEEEAIHLGIPIKTRHNEVAPNQFEIAPIYEEANIAADHNQMLMDLMMHTARKHNMVCLLHEKPFQFFNGSGKHINWSLMDSKGRNLFASGDCKQSRFVFLAFLTGFLIGINRHNDLVQSVLASAGNELRLGGHEAPPSIISTYLGEEIQEILRNLDKFISGQNQKAEMKQFEEFIPPILHDQSDRNRTSPVAFTGNKFEFRMGGSSASSAFPIAVINLAVADGLQDIHEALSPLKNEKDILEKLGHLLKRHSDIIFDGDNYNGDWRKEAETRGLFIPVSVPHTIDRLKHEKNIELFQAFGILNKDEIQARADIKIEVYVKTVEMELRVARYMLRAYIIPAALKNQRLLLESINGFPVQLLKAEPSLLDKQMNFIEKFTHKVNRSMELLAVLDEDNDLLKNGTDREKADCCASRIRPHIMETAALVEKIEERVARETWKMPMITDILFR
ncbi:MAG: glutamine synthetase type III [bacterium]|nr:glutamine synthetase type III [bacterium]